MFNYIRRPLTCKMWPSWNHSWSSIRCVHFPNSCFFPPTLSNLSHKHFQTRCRLKNSLHVIHQGLSICKFWENIRFSSSLFRKVTKCQRVPTSDPCPLLSQKISSSFMRMVIRVKLQNQIVIDSINRKWLDRFEFNSVRKLWKLIIPWVIPCPIQCCPILRWLVKIGKNCEMSWVSHYMAQSSMLGWWKRSRSCPCRWNGWR